MIQENSQRAAKNIRMRQTLNPPHAAAVDLPDLLGKIHCGDCLDIMRKIPNESIDLVLTSPPYNLRNTTGGGLLRDGGLFSEGRKIRGGYNAHDDAMPHKLYVKWQRECLKEMLRVLSPAGAIFYNHKWRVQNRLLQDRSDIVAGFPVRQIIIWKRNGGINFNPGYFLPTYEVIYMIAKPDFKLREKANKIGDVWIINQETNNPHPAPFPIELAHRVISSTNAETVLDPFIGSGTTAMAAILEKRRWMGIEKSREYALLAEQRIKQMQDDKQIF